ncbi:ParB/RepB/Spo0J family partition protein [Streptacidiphilus anmyonensis]|uniref:ParB/RepB/Spo0J family partition protein n=1 Tax=Streptacidiphilus anmyonensis TaxID=405782 RepID=UPI00069378C7|nr:ParB N-terminal domain-containing protein [Streptacidiphilus anmyonensis]
MASTTSQPTSTDDTPAAIADTAVAATRPAAIGTYVEIHPDQLVRDPANVRTDNPEPSAELLQSVEEVGVREPIGVRQLADGKFGVFKGQRRMLAAQAAAAKARKNEEPVRLVPAIVHEIGDDEAEAVLLSLIENKHREAMTARDDVNAVAQLSLLTDDDTQRRTRAAKALGLTPDQVAAAQRARKLTQKSLRTATASGYDLEQMADLVEVEKVPSATSVLDEAKNNDARDGGRGHWQHAMARLRGELEVIERAAAVRAELDAAKVKVVAAQPYYGYGEKPKQHDLAQLHTQLGGPVTAERHAGCPGHAARIDSETGEAVFVCLDPVAHGHKLPKKPVQPRSDADKERHRRVVSHNKAWKAARTVRHQFLAELVARPKVSEAAQLFCLSHLLHKGEGSRRYAEKGELAYVARFLSVPEPKVGARDLPFDGSIAKAMKGRRSANLLLAHVAAVIEFNLDDRAWDHPRAQVKEWLRLLAAEGYTLSEVEAEITGPLPKPAAKAAPKTLAASRSKLAKAA